MKVNLCIFLVWLLFASHLVAATNRTSVVDSGGRWASNYNFKACMAVGQSMTAGMSTNATLILHSGFHNTLLLRPDLDTDRDGIPDENDPDNDNDGLRDEDELTGKSFNPAIPTDPLVADSDNDGMKDGAEAAAGMNPRDAGSALAIRAVSLKNGQMLFSWSGHGSYRYELLKGNSLFVLITNPVVIATTTATNGAGFWNVSEVQGVDTGTSSKAYYRVRVAK